MMYFSISVAAVLGLLVGIVWYGSLFGPLKKRLGLYSEQELKEATKPGVLERVLLHVVILVFVAFILSYVIARVGTTTFLGGAAIGFLAGVVVAVVVLFNGAFGGAEDKHQNPEVFMVDAGHWLLVCTLMASVLAVLG